MMAESFFSFGGDQEPVSKNKQLIIEKRTKAFNVFSFLASALIKSPEQGFKSNIYTFDFEGQLMAMTSDGKRLHYAPFEREGVWRLNRASKDEIVFDELSEGAEPPKFTRVIPDKNTELHGPYRLDDLLDNYRYGGTLAYKVENMMSAVGRLSGSRVHIPMKYALDFLNNADSFNCDRVELWCNKLSVQRAWRVELLREKNLYYGMVFMPGAVYDCVNELKDMYVPVPSESQETAVEGDDAAE